MVRRLELALQRWVVRTNRSPLRHLWRVVYAALAHGAAAWLTRGTAATVYLNGSLASGEPVYGLSDVDMTVVVPDRSMRPEARRRLEVMHTRLPLLSRLIAHVRVYDEQELQSAASGSYLTFALDDGAAAFAGESAVRDEMGLLDRPGLSPPVEGWRRLRGHGLAPQPIRDRHDERLAAWLEIQYRLRWAIPVLAGSEPLNHLAAALGGISRVWLGVVHDEPTAGNRSALWQTAWRLEDEREALWAASHVLETSQSDAASAQELWGCLIRLVARVAVQIELELASVPATEVPLLGVGRGEALPLLDWSGLALPRTEWPLHGLPTSTPPRFQLVCGDTTDPATVADAFTQEPWTTWNTLRYGQVLIRPTLAVGDRGRLRTAELPSSDPVSFALLDGQGPARFPDVRGWSARDRARRAVAEHRGWLFASGETRRSGPEWLGGRAPSDWDTPATRSLLLSAARAGLFLESIEEGEPLLPLDYEATVDAWGRRDPFAGEAAGIALRGLRSGAEYGHQKSYRELVGLVDSLHRMKSYSAPETRRPAPRAPREPHPRGPSANGHNGAAPVRLASFPHRDKNPYMQLLYGALARSGINAVGEGRLDPFWLWRQREEVTFLHFHWDKYYSESTSEDARWVELRSWLKLVRFGSLLVISRWLGYRIIWTVHEVVPHEPRSQRRDLLAARLLARTSHAVMAHDHPTSRRAEAWLGMNPREVTVIPHGSYVGVYPRGRSRADVRRDWNLKDRQLVFLAFGNLRRYKRLELLLDAFSRVDEPDAALVIAGEFVWRFRQPEWEQGMMQRLEESAKRDPRIHYRIGRVPDHMVAELHAACDVAVMPRSDGWTSGSMILALSHGMPVVAARQPAYVELLGGTAAGWLYEPGSADSLADALTAAVRERDLVGEKGREARRRAHGLSWDEVAAETASVLRSTLPQS